MPDPIRVALIGCGGIMVGRHLRLMLQHDDATLVAFTDPVEAARNRARKPTPRWPRCRRSPTTHKCSPTCSRRPW